jgi:hypothetical protein
VAYLKKLRLGCEDFRREICGSTVPSWKCFSTERSAVEGPSRFLFASGSQVEKKFLDSEAGVGN